MTELWIASANRKKREELERLLAPRGYRIRTLDEAGPEVTIVEDGDTFAANARIKATTLAIAVSAPAIGDDSGLCVDALDGRPGVHSARYAGPDATDEDRIHKLLAELDGREGNNARRARFTCHVCLADAQGEVVAAIEEHCEGFIRCSPRGAGGFGYDPVFVPEAWADRDPEPTFAELSAEQKDAISHRGRALRRLLTFLSDPSTP